MAEQRQQGHGHHEPETYEQLRDSSTGEIGSAWQTADKQEQQLQEFYERLKDDPRYTDQHKAELAWQKYEDMKDRILTGRQRSKKRLEERSDSLWLQSVPMPPETGLRTTNENRILMTQSEGTRIARKIDRLADSPGPMRPSTVETLKAEYAKGLKEGGPRGGAICRAVVDVADEFSIDVDDVVDDFREVRHRKLVQQAERSALMSRTIGKGLREPPFRNPHEPSLRAGSYASGASAAGVRGETWEDPSAPGRRTDSAPSAPSQSSSPEAPAANRPRKSSKKPPSHIEKGNVRQLRDPDGP